ncbi:MAG: undecaprenyl-diphosphate phosphatase [Pseudomonadota bacterium]
MEFLEIVAIAIIQGITEFLPISSSGHLRLWPILTGREYQGVTMDVAVHLGTLVAVCLYFRAEVGRIFTGVAKMARGDFLNAEAYLAMLLVIATIPAMVFGLGLKLSGGLDALDADPSLALAVIGWTTLIGGILLWVADRTPVSRDKAETWRIRDAVLMGLAQALALIPGTSRSGITMTMGRWLGFDRQQAARLALLMAVPTIFAAGSLETVGVIADGDLKIGAELLLGALLSFIAAMLALMAMMHMFAASWTMLPFVIYRLILGAILLGLAYA